LEVQNKALLLKHLDEFYNNAYLPWVKLVRDSYYHEVFPHVVTLSGSFLWKSVIRMSGVWRSLSKYRLENGNSILFWDDLWHDEMMSVKFPRPFSYTNDKLVSVLGSLLYDNISRAFDLPLSSQTYLVYNEKKKIKRCTISG
jgi:hypothetical protein